MLRLRLQKKNISYAVEGRRAAVRMALQHPLAKTYGLFEARAGLKRMRRVNIAAPRRAKRKGSVNLPVLPFKEGDVPAFLPLLRLGVASGVINLDNIPDWYLDAYETMAGESVDREILKLVLQGRALLAAALRLALKPLAKAIGLEIQFARNMTRIYGYAA